MVLSGFPSDVACHVACSFNSRAGLCRCGRLRRLILANNELETLPDAIHFLIENLEKFDVSNNPKLRFPPKPPALQKGAGLAYYNIDFSLEGQLQMLSRSTPEPNADVKKAKVTPRRLLFCVPCPATADPRPARHPP